LPFRSQDRFRYIMRTAGCYRSRHKRYRRDRKGSWSLPDEFHGTLRCPTDQGIIRTDLIQRSRVVFRNVLADDALVALQFPIVIRAMGKPVGNADLRVHLTRSHADV
jgi:hypothetical protein